jgi:hypothetical protein
MNIDASSFASPETSYNRPMRGCKTGLITNITKYIGSVLRSFVWDGKGVRRSRKTKERRHLLLLKKSCLKTIRVRYSQERHNIAR